jgi:nicotinic acid phosphoribosyltransferase
MTVAQKLVRLMTGMERPSALMTDAYKNSMAQAGFPLRYEAFYATLRRGGPWYVPFNFEEIIQALVPLPPSEKEELFLNETGYGLTAAMRVALSGKIEVTAAPEGSWILGKEPLLVTKGPSFLVSWLEPLAIMLNFPVQVATAMMNGAREFPCSCSDEASIVQLVARHMGVRGVTTEVDEGKYVQRVRENLAKIKEALGGEIHRGFEVGMRGATCMEQHRLALQECKEAGMTQTSNLFLARELRLTPVGTSGHEHQERWGSDIAGFRAIRDMRPNRPSYLPDTYGLYSLGLPAAIKVIQEEPTRSAIVRLDSGDQKKQVEILLKELPPEQYPLWGLIFEDGYNDKKTREMELYCEAKIARWQRLYGYGGFIVTESSPSPYKRDNASAVYKLCWSAGPRMKTSGTPGKESLPGLPVIFRLIAYQSPLADGLIGQEGEEPPDGYAKLSGAYRVNQAWAAIWHKKGVRPITSYSAATQTLIENLTKEKERM